MEINPCRDDFASVWQDMMSGPHSWCASHQSTWISACTNDIWHHEPWMCFASVELTGGTSEVHVVTASTKPNGNSSTAFSVTCSIEPHGDNAYIGLSTSVLPGVVKKVFIKYAKSLGCFSLSSGGWHHVEHSTTRALFNPTHHFFPRFRAFINLVLEAPSSAGLTGSPTITYWRCQLQLPFIPDNPPVTNGGSSKRRYESRQRRYGTKGNVSSNCKRSPGGMGKRR